MKTIPLKTIQVLLGEKPTNFSYRAQLIEIMRSPSDPRGSDLEEVRRSLRVLDALNAPSPDDPTKLLLEDADFDYMKRRVLSARWPVIDKFVLSFIEDVTKENNDGN